MQNSSHEFWLMNNGGGAGGSSSNSGHQNGSNPPGNDSGQDQDDGTAESIGDCLQEGGCDASSPTYQLDPVEDDPCDDVQEKFEDEDFKERINQLKGKVYESNEYIFTETSDEGVSDLTPGSTTDAPFNLTPQTIGFAHTHPQQYDNIVGGNMFSIVDFLQFRKVLNRSANNDSVAVSDAYAIVMYGTNYYMLKFNGDFGSINWHGGVSERKIEKTLTAKANKFRHYPGVAFIEAVNEITLGGSSTFKNSGFHLMKFTLNSDGSLNTATEISLGHNGDVDFKNCN